MRLHHAIKTCCFARKCNYALSKNTVILLNSALRTTTRVSIEILRKASPTSPSIVFEFLNIARISASHPRPMWVEQMNLWIIFVSPEFSWRSSSKKNYFRFVLQNFYAGCTSCICTIAKEIRQKKTKICDLLQDLESSAAKLWFSLAAFSIETMLVVFLWLCALLIPSSLGYESRNGCALKKCTKGGLKRKYQDTNIKDYLRMKNKTPLHATKKTKLLRSETEMQSIVVSFCPAEEQNCQ